MTHNTQIQLQDLLNALTVVSAMRYEDDSQTRRDIIQHLLICIKQKTSEVAVPFEGGKTLQTPVAALLDKANDSCTVGTLLGCNIHINEALGREYDQTAKQVMDDICNSHATDYTVSRRTFDALRSRADQ